MRRSDLQKEPAYNAGAHLRMIPSCEQTQKSLESQLADLRVVANRLGLYDAADYLARRK